MNLRVLPPYDTQSRFRIGLVAFQLADFIVPLLNGKLLVMLQLVLGDLFWFEPVHKFA